MKKKNRKNGLVILYYHKTDGGAEYFSDTFVKCSNGNNEGTITDKTKYMVRIDEAPSRGRSFFAEPPLPRGHLFLRGYAMNKPTMREFFYSGFGLDKKGYCRALRDYYTNLLTPYAVALVVVGFLFGLITYPIFMDKQMDKKAAKTLENQLAVNAERGFALSPKELISQKEVQK